MPFDPTLPANGSQIVSAELRDQFNALNERIETLEQANSELQNILADFQNQINQRLTEDQLNNIMSAYVATNSSANVNSLDTDTTELHDPPTFDDLDAIRNTLNGLMLALKR